MVYILLGEGFEEMEAAAPGDVLRRGGVEVAYAGIGGKTVKGAHGIAVCADCIVEEIDAEGAEMIVIPGGLGGVESIEGSGAAKKAIMIAHEKGVKLAAICAGPRVLAGLGLLEGKKAVCYPGMEDQMAGGAMTQETSTVIDGDIITGRGPGAAIDFALTLLEVLRGKAEADKIAEDMHYER